ncbi:MAG: 3'-5' exonuclease [Cytophagales bacterium]
MPEYYFRLPTALELSASQNEAINDTNSIALSGGPGTGKSVVSILRHILNHSRENPINSQLITYTTSLAYYLKGCCRNNNVNASEKIDSSLNWKTNHCERRAEIIHDEAQDLPIAYNQRLKGFSDRISYGADNQQTIRGNSRNPDGSYNLNYCSPEENLIQEFPNNSLHHLAKNYRNSKRILQFAKRLLTQAVIPQELIERCTTVGEFPRLIIKNNNQQLNQTVLQIVNQFAQNAATNIGILVPFENVPFGGGENATADYYYDLLSQAGIDCSIYTQRRHGNLQIKNVHITTFKSAKGLEFDVVILPEFHLLNDIFRIVDWRDWYVGITRTKSNLFMISNPAFNNLPNNGTQKLIDKVIL